MIDYAMDATYLVASVFFIIGIKMLSSPETAARGNMLSALGMLMAVGATLVSGAIPDFTWIMVGVVIGSVVGIVGALLVKMNDMPQMVALFNGFGGAASALVAVSEYYRLGAQLSPFITVVILLSLFVGWLTTSGSVVAFLKLQELVSGNAVVFPLQHMINLVLGLGTFAAMGFLVLEPGHENIFFGIIAMGLLLGVLLVIPIGGADMPVVIALLNSYSGIAVSFTGFVLSNNVLIITGSLVGASGIFLTKEMCDGMNRSIWNVLFGGFGADAGSGVPAMEAPGGIVKPYTIEDAITVLENADQVVFVPGYGMAAAQAQHVVRELGEALEDRGITVKYAVHPVAGRMPGHMNVLLAEANVSYDALFDMDQINDDFVNTDVSVIIGANDVVNPAAEEDPSSPIYGMPILHVDRSKTVIVLKRSMNPGFAGIDNLLFYRDNTMMVFGDAKATLTKFNEGIKAG
ncbi:MAG: NAD(P)(+) transhydrogenase (Re/Si-specific) subunit beta [Deltaproteobacteria bacterium]|nr:NAD(P)(+) transhydrogenase (Re/Si-specific) subunit beta [Deltaproteobacteria bacterium]